jgi:hypothetical protein
VVNKESMLKALALLMDEWPCGEVVWNRATGKRAIIVGYKVLADQSTSLMCDYGGDGYATEMPLSMSASRVSDGTEGDEWKDGKEGSGV